MVVMTPWLWLNVLCLAIWAAAVIFGLFRLGRGFARDWRRRRDRLDD